MYLQIRLITFTNNRSTSPFSFDFFFSSLSPLSSHWHHEAGVVHLNRSHSCSMASSHSIKVVVGTVHDNIESIHIPVQYQINSNHIKALSLKLSSSKVFNSQFKTLDRPARRSPWVCRKDFWIPPHPVCRSSWWSVPGKTQALWGGREWGQDNPNSPHIKLPMSQHISKDLETESKSKNKNRNNHHYHPISTTYHP